MMVDPLVKRLRDSARVAARANRPSDLLSEAAERIDILSAENARLRAQAEDRVYD